MQAKLSNFQYRPSEKVPNPGMKHRQAYFQIGNCHFGLQCTVTIYAYHLNIFNFKKIDGVTHSVHQGPRCAICIIQYGPRQKWEERGTGQT